MFDRTPKPYPGDYFSDQFPNQIDPRGDPTFIVFQWDPQIKTMQNCDTIHMLFLLQNACELHRLRVIERNKYFMSISRPDRYIQHVDGPQIITNFLEWHLKDKEKNVFNGEMMITKKKLFMINDMISDIGDVRKGPATRIFTKLRKEVMIEYDSWTKPQDTKLKLFTWGLTQINTEALAAGWVRKQYASECYEDMGFPPKGILSIIGTFFMQRICIEK